MSNLLDRDGNVIDHDKLRQAVKWARQQGIELASAWGDDTRRNSMLCVLADAAESTLPRTKMETVWRVEYCVVNGDRDSRRPWREGIWTFTNPGDARVEAEQAKSQPGNFACVKVTGPHQQEVPA